jgi:hypothetical protein
MKPLLRAVLIIDALLLLAFGLLFLLTPWTSLYNALQLVQTEPTLVGQGLGIALIGLAWLAFHASIDGALTATVSKVVGHVNWLTGLLMLVWLWPTGGSTGGRGAGGGGSWRCAALKGSAPSRKTAHYRGGGHGACGAASGERCCPRS